MYSLIDKEELVEALDKMSRERFQRLAIEVLNKMGFDTLSARSFGGDFEAEAELRRDGAILDYVIRVTRSGGDPSKEVEGLKNALGPGVRGLYITTSHIPEQLTDIENIEVAGAEELYQLMMSYDLLSEFDVRDEMERSLPSASEFGRLMDWGDDFRDKGNPKKALEYYDRAIDSKPESYKPRVKKAETLLEMDEPHKAIDEMKDFMEVGIENPEVWVTMGKAYHELERYQDEIEAYDRALDINEDHGEAWSLKGTTLYEQGLYEEANLCFERILEVEPKDVGAWNNKGLCLFKMGDLPAALNALNNALAIDHRYVDALINKALVLENQNKMQKALQVAHELTMIRPVQPEFHYIKAAYHEAVGEIRNALKSVDIALSLKPDYDKAIKLKARLELRKDEDVTTGSILIPEKQDIQHLEGDRDYILQKIHSLEQDISELRSMKHGIDHRLHGESEEEDIKRDVEEHDDEISHLKSEKVRLEKELSKIWQKRLEDESREEDFNKLEKEKEMLERELRERENLLEEMERTKELLEEELRELKEDRDVTSQEEEDVLVGAIEEREHELEELIKDKTQMAEKLEESMNKIGLLQDKIITLEDEIERHQEEVKKRDSIIDEIRSKELEIEELAREREELLERLDTHSSEIDRLKEEKEILETEVRELRREREKRELRRKETHQRLRKMREVDAKENVKILLRSAELLFKMGENEKVLDLVSDRGKDKLLNIEGCAYYEKRRIGEAVNCFRDTPDSIGRYNQEEVSYEMGQYRNSADLCEEIYQHYSGVTVYWERRGEAYRRLDTFDKAIESYDRALSLVGKEIDEFRGARARCTVKRNGLVSGINELEKRLDERYSPELENLLGAFRYKKREYKKAVDNFRNITAVNEGLYYNNLGCTAYQLERYGEALSALEKAVELVSNNTVFLNNLGFCQLERDLKDAAKDNFQKAIDIDEDDPVGWYNLGIVMKRMGEKDWKDKIKRSVELAPGFKEAVKMLEM